MKDIRQYIGRDLPAEVLAELKARHGTTVVRRDGVRRDVIQESDLAERIGEVRLEKGVDCTFEVQSARIPEWDAHTGAWLGYQSHEDWFRVVIPGANGSGDYCLYCGAFNGPRSEDRIGFDCRYCGCN
jgi:hypothetical protein